MSVKNRRLVQGEDIIYPITKQENVIGLQKTIKEKMPIISENQPQSGFVNRQTWIKVEDTIPNEDAVPDISEVNGNNPAQVIENNYEIGSGQENYENGNIEYNYEGEN